MIDNNNNSESLNWKYSSPLYILKLEKMKFNHRNIPFTKAEVESLPLGRTHTALYASREFTKQVERNPKAFMHLIQDNVKKAMQDKIINSKIEDDAN